MEGVLAWRQVVVSEDTLISGVSTLLKSLGEEVRETGGMDYQPTVQITPLVHGQYAKYHVLVMARYMRQAVEPDYGGNKQ